MYILCASNRNIKFYLKYIAVIRENGLAVNMKYIPPTEFETINLIALIGRLLKMINYIAGSCATGSHTTVAFPPTHYEYILLTVF